MKRFTELCPLCKSPWVVTSIEFVIYGHYCRYLEEMLYWNYSEMSTDPERLTKKRRDR